MSRRPRSLASAVEMLQRQLAGSAALEDPFAGVISERAYLYAPDGGRRSGGWGFDGTRGSAERIHVHRDGYSSAHVGACALEPETPLVERLIRQAGLDRDEAELLRHVFDHLDRGDDWRAAHLKISLRTYQRRERAIREKLAALQLDLDDLA